MERQDCVYTADRFCWTSDPARTASETCMLCTLNHIAVSLDAITTVLREIKEMV